MIGLPVIPAHEFPTQAQAACFAFHATADPDFGKQAKAFLARGGAAIFTRSAATAAGVAGSEERVQVFTPPRDTREIMQFPADEIAALRQAALEPLGMALQGPVGTALYLFGERKVALENFRDQPAEMRLRLADADRYRMAFSLGREGAQARAEGEWLLVSVPPRSLAALERPG
jgi:hypothetical protein